MRHPWITSALLGSLALMGTAPVAWGQIAAPSIVPGVFTYENPAVTKWASPSAIGLGGGSMQTTDDPGGSHNKYAAGYLGFRAVGERFALAASDLHEEDQESSLNDVRDFGTVALAVQTGSALAWGLGYNAQTETQNKVKTTGKEPVFGVSLRLADVWFLGGTVGRETVSQKDSSGATPNIYGERDTLRAGVGFRTGGTVLTHGEVFGIHKDDYDTNQGKFGGEDTTGGTLEFTFWSFLLGGSARHTVYKDATNTTSDMASGDIGWAPRHGMSITLHYDSTIVRYDKSQSPTLTSHQEDLGALLVAYQF